MKNKKLLVTFVLALFVICAVVLGMSGMNFHAPSIPNADSVSKEEKTDENEEPQEDKVAKLCIAGDIVLHKPIYLDAYALSGEDYDFGYIFEDCKPYFEAADYSCCVLETTFNKPETDYSGYPLFNSPDSLAYNLKDAGLDLIATACNHSLDTWFSGLCRTLDVLEDAGLEHVGTYRSQAERDENSGVLLKDINGIKVAFLSYTYGTNGLPLNDYTYSVNVYTNDYMTTLEDVKYDMISADLDAAKAMNPDIIAVFMHWGAEYNTGATEQQTKLADFLFENGVDLVLGGHTHVPGSVELREVTTADGETKTGYLCYCMGNFISNQQSEYTNLTALMNIELTKNGETGKTEISACSYVPMYMLHPDTSATGHYLLADLKQKISDYENGDKSVVRDDIYPLMVQGLSDIHSIMNENEVLK